MLLLGKPAAEELYSQAAEKIKALREIPGLLVYRKEGDELCQSYLSMIERNFTKRGVPLLLCSPDNKEAMNEKGLGGAILISKVKEPFAIPAALDVDGTGEKAIAALYSGGGYRKDTPCTAEACLRLLDFYGIPLRGRRAVVLGRSNTVGKPLGLLLLGRDATVTLCHSKSENLPDICREADILICAAGKPGLVTEDFIRPGQTVLNVGGDAVETKIAPYVEHLAPFRGGVGPMTTAVLLWHTLLSGEQEV